MSTPNIFSYATKELSQDAFICWLIACASEATGHLRKCGLAFVHALFRAGASDGTRYIPVLDSAGNLMASYDGSCKVSDVCTPIGQYQKIDVYFQAKVDGKKVSFIIEDKTDGQPGEEGQLKKYLKSVIEDTEEKDLIKPVYFKTGYVFNDEQKDVEENNYSVFNAEDLKNFLDCHSDAIRENQILCQYSEYLNEKIEARNEALANWDLDQNYVQWEFMQKLRGVLRDAACKWNHFVPDELSGEPKFEWNWNGLGRDNNLNSKSPWTHYWFSKHLLWRLDRKWPVNPNLRVQLRLIIVREDPGGSKEESDDIVYEYRKHFKKVLQEAKLRTGGVQLRNVKDVHECTIGSVDIVNETDIANETTKFQGLTEDEFLDRVKQVHIRFLDSISQQG